MGKILFKSFNQSFYVPSSSCKFFNSVKNQMGHQGVEVFSKNDVIIANF